MSRLSGLCSVILLCTGTMFGATLPLEPQGWNISCRGAWQVRADHRALLAMRHPWVPSHEGDSAQASRFVTAPADWTGPVLLSLYCSDDYEGRESSTKGSWETAEGFIGHRFKQVLIDGKVVWSADVADPAGPLTQSPRHRIPLDVTPGRQFLLSLVAFDAVASTTRLPGDFYQPGDAGLTRETDPDASRFMTHVYWGDIVLISEQEEVAPGRRPSEFKVIETHNRRWPLPPFGDGWESDTVPLQLAMPKGLPASGFPVRQGLPFPAGKITDVQAFRLQTPAGAPVYVQRTPLGSWPDGSLRWVLLDFLAKSEMQGLKVVFKQDNAAKPQGLVLREVEEGIQASTGNLTLQLGSAELLANAVHKKKTVLHSIELSLRVRGEDIGATVDDAEIIAEGPFRASVMFQGRFETLDRRAASFAATVDLFAGQSLLRLWLRVFNDTQENLPLSALKLDLRLPGAPRSWMLPSGEVIGDFKLIQRDEGTRVLDESVVDARAPAFVSWDEGCCVVRRFRELFPKSFSAAGEILTLDLAAGGDAPVVFTPGEAVSHECWLAFGKADVAALAVAAETPPILQNPEYFCATGVFGPARTHAKFPKLRDYMAATYGNKTWTDLRQRLGLRHFPDSPYIGGLPKWCNDYYSRMHNLYSEWFLSGDRAWYDRADDVCRHIMDVAVVHSEVPGRDWEGALHGPGEDHVAGPWAATLRTAGLELYHKLTGDPDARTAFLGVADYCLRTGAGMDGDSIRQHAGAFDAVVTAYWETGDVAFLEEGAKRVERMRQAVDPRRGVWPDAHGSRVYRGNVPWMAAQLARPLYWWYSLTGDVEAAQLLVGLAESIICENTDWDQPGVVSGYSHNPHYAMTAAYDLSILPMIFAAYELTEDPFFLDAAKAQWRRWLASDQFDSVFNVYWNTPWLVWHLEHHGLLAEQAVVETSPEP